MTAMMTSWTAVATMLCATMLLADTGAARAADAANGGRIAQRWCVECHVVAPGQKQASADVPGFAAIAAKPDFNERALAFFLLDPHPKMPNLNLGRGEAQDIAAYIATLR
jgi:mono/diheme cytochrome c family protein